MLTFYCVTDFQILERRLEFLSFKSKPFQLSSDRTALFVTLKQWKSLSINQVIRFTTVIIVTKRYHREGTTMQIQVLVIQVPDMCKWSIKFNILSTYMWCDAQFGTICTI